MSSGSIRNSAIAELRIVHWQIWKTCVVAFCVLRKQSCGIAYCGPEKHVALPTSAVLSSSIRNKSVLSRHYAMKKEGVAESRKTVWHIFK
jgi:hypothetical protein